MGLFWCNSRHVPATRRLQRRCCWSGHSSNPNWFSFHSIHSRVGHSRLRHVESISDSQHTRRHHHNRRGMQSMGLFWCNSRHVPATRRLQQRSSSSYSEEAGCKRANCLSGWSCQSSCSSALPPARTTHGCSLHLQSRWRCSWVPSGMSKKMDVLYRHEHADISRMKRPSTRDKRLGWA
jgi:hypothetical protein